MICLLTRPNAAVKDLRLLHLRQISSSSEVVLNIADFAYAGHNFTPRVGRAREVACYSLRSTGKMSCDNSSLRRFVAPAPGTDLKLGLRGYTRLDPKILRQHGQPSKLDSTLEACLASPTGLQSLLEADVVARQGVIRKILHGYADFYASYIDGRLYLQGIGHTAKRNYSLRNFFSGQSFLRACTTYANHFSPRLGSSDGFESFQSVVARSLGGLNLLLSGEIHCIAGSYHKVPNTYVELKCPQVDAVLHRKYKDWALRMHLMGIPQLYLGVQDKNHVLQGGDFMSLKDLTDEHWDLQRVYNFGFRALCSLRDYLQDASDALDYGSKRWSKHTHNRVWLCQVRGKTDPGASIRIRELSRDQVFALQENGVQRRGIVPNWCLERMNLDASWTASPQ